MGFGPAVTRKEDGKISLHHISASQVNTFEACPHRWFEEKVNKAPSFQDWSWAEAGVAAHEILEEQVGWLIEKEFDESKRRVLDVKVQEEAEQLVSFFNWEEHFEDHQIMDVEMDLVLNLSELNKEMNDEEEELPLFVGSMDVVSMNKEGVVVVTDWKTGYGADKGVDIQVQGYALAVIQNMGVDEVIFRRIYPRLAGEEKGTRKVEEYYLNASDARQYAKKIIYIARKMKQTAESERKPMVTASNTCVHCPVAYRCPIANKAAFSPAELTKKLKVLKAAQKQVETALKNTVDEGGDFFVGEEHYGYTISEFYRGPRGGLKSEDVSPALLKNAIEVLENEAKTSINSEKLLEAKKELELVASKSKITVDTEIKEKLEKLGHTGYKNFNRKTFKLLNEKELKDAQKESRKKESTIADSKKSKKVA